MARLGPDANLGEVREAVPSNKKNIFQEIAAKVKEEYDIFKKSRRLWELQQDPEWALQAGLGDMEFEQDMYDDIMEYDRPYEGEPRVDRVALEGLRKHSKEGLNRYVDVDPYREKKEHEWGSYETGIPSWLHKGVPENTIDINLLNLLGDVPWMDEDALKWMGYKGSLQDKISDTYRHEYKHAAGKDLIKGPENIHPYISSEFYYNRDPAMYLLDWDQHEWNEYNKEQAALKQQRFNEGGLVSILNYA